MQVRLRRRLLICLVALALIFVPCRKSLGFAVAQLINQVGTTVGTVLANNPQVAVQVDKLVAAVPGLAVALNWIAEQTKPVNGIRCEAVSAEEYFRMKGVREDVPGAQKYTEASSSVADSSGEIAKQPTPTQIPEATLAPVSNNNSRRQHAIPGKTKAVKPAMPAPRGSAKVEIGTPADAYEARIRQYNIAKMMRFVDLSTLALFGAMPGPAQPGSVMQQLANPNRKGASSLDTLRARLELAELLIPQSVSEWPAEFAETQAWLLPHFFNEDGSLKDFRWHQNGKLIKTNGCASAILAKLTRDINKFLTRVNSEIRADWWREKIEQLGISYTGDGKGPKGCVHTKRRISSEAIRNNKFNGAVRMLINAYDNNDLRAISFDKNDGWNWSHNGLRAALHEVAETLCSRDPWIEESPYEGHQWSDNSIKLPMSVILRGQRKFLLEEKLGIRHDSAAAVELNDFLYELVEAQRPSDRHQKPLPEIKLQEMVNDFINKHPIVAGRSTKEIFLDKNGFYKGLMQRTGLEQRDINVAKQDPAPTENPGPAGPEIQPGIKPETDEPATKPSNGSAESDVDDVEPKPEVETNPIPDTCLEDNIFEMDLNECGEYQLQKPPPPSPSGPGTSLKPPGPKEPSNGELVFRARYRTEEIAREVIENAKTELSERPFPGLDETVAAALDNIKTRKNGKLNSNQGKIYELEVGCTIKRAEGEIEGMNRISRIGEQEFEIDILATDKHGRRYAIECKSWDWKMLSPEKIKTELDQFITRSESIKRLFEGRRSFAVVTPEKLTLDHIPDAALREEVISLLNEARGEGIQFLSLDELAWRLINGG